MTLYTADFFGVIRTLFIIVLLYYLFKFAVRLLTPLLINKLAKKAQENFRQQQETFYKQHQNQNKQNQYQQSANQPKKQELKEKKKVGEYIDFEEIE